MNDIQITGECYLTNITGLINIIYLLFGLIDLDPQDQVKFSPAGPDSQDQVKSNSGSGPTRPGQNQGDKFGLNILVNIIHK